VNLSKEDILREVQKNKNEGSSPNREQIIVRQACLKASAEYLSTRDGDVLKLAEEMEKWVWRRNQK
jgi:hypothetical protein